MRIRINSIEHVVVAGLWCGTCLNGLLLVINRLLDLWNKRIMGMCYINVICLCYLLMMFIYIKMFYENRTYLMMFIPISYALYFMFFTPPLIFNADHMAWFFSTLEEDIDIGAFHNYSHTVNNLFVVIITCLLYVVYSKVLLRHSKASKLTWAQKSHRKIKKALPCLPLLLIVA
ncbi:hypothetical protein DICVIV_06621 [Dictyocaulus viviparus]|uniref:7TM GPCR serpentine receptor class x (Srx) domain-containing protein n=1 Tax=Dictyocaulus viviparus TaxID=29172 RepID=A0A0D8XS27_DICVI|nr:hypothetical protein DICVIV_06621 [Dictyocaulus viviparus]